jgi:outer membrane protein assembly factor BamB
MDGNHIFATTAAGQIYAWDARSGEYLWAYNTGVELVMAPLTDGEAVAVHTTAGEILFFNASDGSLDSSRTLTPGGGWGGSAIGGGWWFVPSWALFGYGPSAGEGSP